MSATQPAPTSQKSTTTKVDDMFVEKEQEFPKNYWGVVEEVDYDPKHGDYKQPTIILSIKAYSPPYEKNQIIFLKVDGMDQTFGSDSANPVSILTYTGVFFKALMMNGFSIKPGEKVLDVANRLKAKHVHVLRKSPIELTEYLKGVKVKGNLKTQKDKLVIVEVSDMKPSTI